MGYQVSGEVYATMCSFTEYIRQLISFAKYTRYLSLHINKFSVHVCLITWIRCARCLLSSTRYTMLAWIAHLVGWVWTLSN